MVLFWTTMQEKCHERRKNLLRLKKGEMKRQNYSGNWIFMTWMAQNRATKWKKCVPKQIVGRGCNFHLFETFCRPTKCLEKDMSEVSSIQTIKLNNNSELETKFNPLYLRSRFQFSLFNFPLFINSLIPPIRLQIHVIDISHFVFVWRMSILASSCNIII